MKEMQAEKLMRQGQVRIAWAKRGMPVLSAIEERFSKEQPLRGMRIAACLHVTAETGVLMQALRAGGAEIRLCGSNPLSTQDDVVAALDRLDGIEMFARHGVGNEEYYEHIAKTLEFGPHIAMDDGCDLVTHLHTKTPALLANVLGGTEETTTGVIRLRSMAHEGVLRYPVIAVNEAATKHMFDNRYGTGQSTIDGILRATNQMLAGSCFVVVGFGWCGRGVAARAAGMGARVVVVECDPIRALEASMEGYQVMSMLPAARIGDIFCTVTGNKHALRREHMEQMKDGAMLCNSGHFNVEIDLDGLRAMAVETSAQREGVEAFMMPDGRALYVLGEGRLVNLATAEGHPPQVMDLSFANQALSVEHLVLHAGEHKPGVHVVPTAIDREVAALKLAAMGIELETLTEDQRRYQASWRTGT